MLSLVIIILFSLGVAYFALQNSSTASINLVGYRFTNIPIYFIIIFAVLTGVLMSWLISAVNSASYFLRLRRKESVIAVNNKTIENLKGRINSLEVKNAALEGKRNPTDSTIDKKEEVRQVVKPTLFTRIWHPTTW